MAVRRHVVMALPTTAAGIVNGTSFCHAGSYRRSLLKAYQKTMDEKRFNIVIVDAPNLLIEDFKPYWSAGQVSIWHCAEH